MEKKTGDSENKSLFDRDASLLFDEELKQFRNEKQQSIKRHVTSPEAKSRRESKHKFYERVLSAFETVEAETYKTGETYYSIAEALENLLLKSEPNLYGGASIFGMLCSLIRQDEARFINAAPPHRQEIVMGHLYESLRSSGVNFCVQRLKGQIDESDLPKSFVLLTDLKKRITEDRFSDDLETNQLHFTESFIAEAATLLIKDIERIINLEASEIAINDRLKLKNQLEAIEGKKINTPEFTTTRQVLALRYLLQFAQAQDKKNNARKNFIHFITGKDKSTIFKKFDDETLAYNKHGEDVSFIKKQFEDLGLTEIVKMIDNDSM